MIEYNKEKEFILDCIRGEVMVVELNCKNLKLNTLVNKRLDHEFPEFNKHITKLFVNEKLIPGSSVIKKIDNFIICGVVNSVGLNDDKNTVLHFTEKALDNLISNVGRDKQFISNKFINGWVKMHKKINEYNLNWKVYLG